MNTQELKINIPEGYEIDKEKSTFENIVFKRIKKRLVRFWEDLEVVSGYYTLTDSRIEEIRDTKTTLDNINVFPTKEEALASLALAQLCQLRDDYNDGWKPNWEDENEEKHCIFFVKNRIKKATYRDSNCLLSFKTLELRDKFLENFKDLIEQAKPLL